MQNIFRTLLTLIFLFTISAHAELPSACSNDGCEEVCRGEVKISALGNNEVVQVLTYFRKDSATQSRVRVITGSSKGGSDELDVYNNGKLVRTVSSSYDTSKGSHRWANTDFSSGNGFVSFVKVKKKDLDQNRISAEHLAFYNKYKGQHPKPSQVSGLEGVLWTSDLMNAKPSVLADRHINVTSPSVHSVGVFNFYVLKQMIAPFAVTPEVFNFGSNQDGERNIVAAKGIKITTTNGVTKISGITRFNEYDGTLDATTQTAANGARVFTAIDLRANISGFSAKLTLNKFSCELK